MKKIKALALAVISEFKDLYSVRRMMRGKESPKK